MKLIAFVLSLFISFFSLAQSQPGINFVHNLSWQEILAKAREQNKLIFIDCYATWCAPCKRMNDDVFSLDQVGEYMNNKFISVKLQMDKTAKDDQLVKNWYPQATAFAEQYKITAFPSYLFFSANGKLIHKEVGFKKPDEFMHEAQIAMTPGHVYSDPYAGYEKQLIDYRAGKKLYDKLPSMIKTARTLHRAPQADSLVNDYFQYLSTLKKKSDLYTPVNIGFIAENIKTARNPYFSLFYPDGVKVDKLMKKQGYAKATALRIIGQEDVQPFVGNFWKTTTEKAVMGEGVEPDWDVLTRSITEKYNAELAGAAVRSGKVRFYWVTQARPAFAEAYIKTIMTQIRSGDLDTTDPETDNQLNTWAWIIFVTSKDKEQIEMAIQKIKEVIGRGIAFKKYPCLVRDTYANLLYKASILFEVNRVDEAIAWEKKALENAVERDFGAADIQKTIDKMSRREPTWRVK